MSTPSLPFYGVSIHVTVTVAPENVDQLISLLKPTYDLVAAEQECTFIEVYKNIMTPGEVTWVEGWTKDVQWIQEV